MELRKTLSEVGLGCEMLHQQPLAPHAIHNDLGRTFSFLFFSLLFFSFLFFSFLPFFSFFF